MADDGKHHQEFRARRVDGTNPDGNTINRSQLLFSVLNSIFVYFLALEDAAGQSRLTHDRMSAEESRLFPEICKGDISRHKAFLIIRNNIVRKRPEINGFYLFICLFVVANVV